MLYKYSEFCLESASKGGWFHIFSDGQTNYRLYYTKNRKYDFSNIKELKGLKQETYINDSEGIVCIQNFSDPVIHLIENIEDAISRFVDVYANEIYSELYFLKDGDFIYLDQSVEQVQHNNPILSWSDDEIYVFDKAEEIYPILLKELENQNAKAKILFSGNAEGFKNTDFYKSITVANKYKMFEKHSNGQLLLFYKDNLLYKLYFTKNYEELLKDQELSKLTVRILEHYDDEAIIYLSGDDRDRKNYDLFDDSVCEDLEEAIDNFIIGFENERYPEIHILKDGEYIYLDFSDEELDHNNPILWGCSNDIQINDRAEEIYPLIYNKVEDANIKFAKKAKGFENTNLYKSLVTGKKYNLFESTDLTFKYIVLQSYVDIEYDYITLSNVENPVPAFTEDFIASVSIKLERPLRINDKIYAHLSYVDDTIRFHVSLDKKIVTKDFIEQYDSLVENDLLRPDEIFGKVSKLYCSKYLTTSDFLKNGNDSIISKVNDGPEMYSFDDEIVFSVIDNNTNTETIKNIVWNDPNFVEKHDILKSTQALKKFSI